MTTRREAREGVSEVLDSFNDPEQQKKFEEIVDMLLAAGYFRARISALSPFDKDFFCCFLKPNAKRWLLELSDVDVEVDIFFQEEAPLGTKIKLGETIIRALNRMKCPHPLQPQQIQGLDFINIFPVIQWLVKKVIETRLETGDLIRVFSEYQFKKSMKLPVDAEFEARKQDATAFVGNVLHRYRPTRQYRRGSDVQAKTLWQDEEEAVQYTLLEYGNMYRASRVDASQQNKPKRPQSQYGGNPEEEEEKRRKRAEAEEKRIKAMSDALSQAGEGGRVTGNLVSGLVSMQRDDISQAVSQYGEGLPAGTVARSPAERKAFLEAQFKRSEEHKHKQIADKEAKLKELREKHEKLAAQVRALQTELNKRAKLNARIEKEIDKLNSMETPENTHLVKQLRALVAENELLKAQEAAFKANCKRQKAELEKKIAAISHAEPTEEEQERKRMVEETFVADSARLQESRLLLAKRNRDIVTVERKIDEIPSRSELQQYQREFIELYEQVAAKETETRQYYVTYNTLDDTRTFLSKEVSILASIQENYKAALATPTNRAKFIESLENIIKSVTTSLEQRAHKAAEEKKIRDGLNDKYLQLVEKERAYYKAAKEFQEECKKNEALQARLG